MNIKRQYIKNEILASDCINSFIEYLTSSFTASYLLNIYNQYKNILQITFIEYFENEMLYYSVLETPGQLALTDKDHLVFITDECIYIKNDYKIRFNDTIDDFKIEFDDYTETPQNIINSIVNILKLNIPKIEKQEKLVEFYNHLNNEL